MTGLPFVYGAVFSTVVILLFTYFSGFWGVAVTDYIQFIIMGLGVAAAAFYVFKNVGGWEGITTAVPHDHLTIPSDMTAIIRLIFTTSLSAFIDGNRYQRFYACKDAKTAKKGTLLSIIPAHTFFMMILLLGTCAYALLVAATNFSNDIYKNIINPSADDKTMLRITKRTTLVLGIGGLAMALWLQSIMSIWNLAAAAYIGGCFIPMLYAFFSKKGKKSTLAANVSMVAGSVTAVVIEVQGASVLGLPGAAVGTLLNFILFFGITALDKKASSHSLTDLK